MAKKHKEIAIVHKVRLKELINSLNDMYSQGIDYVDIGIMNDEEKHIDVLRIGYKIDYLSEDALNNLEGGITDDELDKLINGK